LQRGRRAGEAGHDAIAGRRRHADAVRSKRRVQPGVEINPYPVKDLLADPDSHRRRTDLIGEQNGPGPDGVARCATRDHRKEPTPAPSARRPVAAGTRHRRTIAPAGCKPVADPLTRDATAQTP
jgi:hypothetical protein